MSTSVSSAISDAEQRSIWLTEYTEIEELHRHYDSLNMSIMAILVAGVFTVWGFVLQQATEIKPTTTFLLEWLTFVILSIWIRFLTVHRIIVSVKLERAREIESLLGMEQNMRCVQCRRRLRGHALELAEYLVLTIAGVVFTLFFQVGLNDPAITTLAQISRNIQSNWTSLHAVRLGLSLFPAVIALYWVGNSLVHVVKATGKEPPRKYRWYFAICGYRTSKKPASESGSSETVATAEIPSPAG